MVKRELTKVFLSASIPSIERDKKFYDTADVIAIRDSVKALASVVLPKAQLIWGGHPAITPLIRYVMQRMDISLKKHVTLYQTNYYENLYPPDNSYIEDIHLTPNFDNKDLSVQIMREHMFMENKFSAGIFIGGMEGVLEEYSLFKILQPDAIILPIGSTGAAAKMLYEGIEPKPDIRLLKSYAYMALFKDLLKNYL